VFVERLQSFKCTFNRLGSGMQVSLTDGHTAVSSDSHDCKCVGTSFAQSGQKRVAKRVKNEILTGCFIPALVLE
jgi:hypothetical protein